MTLAQLLNDLSVSEGFVVPEIPCVGVVHIAAAREEMLLPFTGEYRIVGVCRTASNEYVCFPFFGATPQQSMKVYPSTPWELTNDGAMAKLPGELYVVKIVSSYRSAVQ